MSKMNVLIYSYFPLRANHWAGGAQTFLGELIQGLARYEFAFRVVCPKVHRGERLLESPSMQHFPVLDEPAEQYLKFDVRARNLTFFQEHLDWADVVWTIDEPFPLRVVQPVVSSLQTMDGFEENQSVLCFQWDTLVAASTFLADCVRAVAGTESWIGEALPQIRTVHNGIDLNHFRRVDPHELMTRLRLTPDRHYLVFPHRPELAKGFNRAMAVMQSLKKRRADYVLLVPADPICVGAVRSRQTEFYRVLWQRIHDEGLSDHIVLHEWISPIDMPPYLSLAKWCLVTSLLPEGFCFVPVQSIACGTPVVSSRCGAIRDRFGPGHGVFYFDTDDNVEETVDTIMSEPPNEELQIGRRYVEQEYDIALCARRYTEILRGTVPSRGAFRHRSFARVGAAPWWYEEGTILPDGGMRVWHDLQMRHVDVAPSQAAILRVLREQGPQRAESFQSEQIRSLFDNTLVLRC